jgi:outer membrane protein assembly factor BamB
MTGMRSFDIILGERWRTDERALERLSARTGGAPGEPLVVQDVIEIVVDGLTVTAHVPQDNVFQITNDLVHGLLAVAAGTRSKCLVQFHEGPWELCVARRGAEALLSFYGTMPPRGVVIKDRAVPMAALCDAAARAAERLVRTLARVNGALRRDEPVVALGRAARQLRRTGGAPETGPDAATEADPGAGAAAAAAAAAETRAPDAPRAGPHARGRAGDRSRAPRAPEVTDARAGDARARGGRRHGGWWRRAPDDGRLHLAWWFDARDEFLSAYDGESRYDLHALLARGQLGLRTGEPGGGRDFSPGFPVLDVEAWVAALQQLVLAVESGERDARVELPAAGAALALGHGGRVAVRFDADRGDEPALVRPLGDLVAAVVESGRTLCDALLAQNPRLRANLRLADLRDEVDELAGWQSDLQDEVVNREPERYLPPPAPGAGRAPEHDGAPAAAAHEGRAIAGAARVRFAERWRLEADAVELTALLPDGRLLCRLDGRLLCLDAESGRSAWRLGAGVSSGAVLFEDGSALLASGAGHLACYRTSDGTKLWEAPGQGADEPRAAGRPFRVQSGGRPHVIAGTGDGRLLCLDAETGARAWEFATRRGGGLALAQAERLLYVASASGAVCALDLADGRLVWRWKARGRLEHAPLPWRDLLIVCGGRSPAEEGRVYALDALTGELRWQRRVGAAIESPPLLHGGRLFVPAEQAGGARLSAIRLADGVVLWRKELDSAGVAPLGAPVEAAGAVLVKTDAGVVHAFDPATGERRWTVSLAGGVVPDVLRNAPLRRSGDALYAGYDAAYVIDPAAGRVMHRIEDQGGIPDDLLVDGDGRLFVCEEGDHVAAHKLTTVLRLVK